MLLLGIDLGSSSVKASVIDGNTGILLATAFEPKEEMEIMAVQPGWAEQDPSKWWEALKIAVKRCTSQPGLPKNDIGAIGISYQMHGLVAVDADNKPLRPSIIWCDSRAVSLGAAAFSRLGPEFCLSHLLNSPGNFTAAKLAWVKQNEPDVYGKIDAVMLPGDYIALMMTGERGITMSGLSEGIFWDFPANKISADLLSSFGFDSSMFPAYSESFSIRGKLRRTVADELGLPEGIPVSYLAGDQPNNALSLNVLEPGEVAATAGTSGVIYGVTDMMKADPLSRVNTFLHVNHTSAKARLGVLLCINGTGILNSWLRRNTGNDLSYNDMNALAEAVPAGSDGLLILPFGNGSERILGNNNPGASLSGLDFNRHSRGHLFRAAQEGIAFSFRYGLDIMRETGIDPKTVRAGEANMFLSRLFRSTLASLTGTSVTLYNTDGSAGAARGAGIGCGFYASAGEAFSGLKQIDTTDPDPVLADQLHESYEAWLNLLNL